MTFEGDANAPEALDATDDTSHEAFLVEQYELHVSTYKVIASSAAEAIAKVLGDKAELVDNSSEYVEVCDAFGMPVEGNEELADQLSEMNVSVDEDIIPTIRSVRRLQ